MGAPETPQLFVIAVFTLVYLVLVIKKRLRTPAVWVGVLALLGAKYLWLGKSFLWSRPHGPLTDINWNVLGIFLGTVLVAEALVGSGVPAAMVDRLVRRSRSAGAAMLYICLLSSVISIFAENVATVVIVAPLALDLSRRARVSQVPLMIAVAICSNLQGTATLIGDPPSMILAGYERMSFGDFFFYHGKPSIFFAVELGAIASFGVLALLFRRHREPVPPVPETTVISWWPLTIMSFMIVALAVSPVWDPEFRYLGGIICLVSGAVAYLWHRAVLPHEARKSVFSWTDISTTLFLAGVFVLVGALSRVGAVELVAGVIQNIFHHSLVGIYGSMVGFSVGVSAFLDNVPYVTAMIPVAHLLAENMGVAPSLLVFGLLIGACLGGNITPIGAAANIVAIGMLRREGEVVGFGRFVAIGLPFTLAATSVAALFIWVVWA